MGAFVSSNRYDFLDKKYVIEFPEFYGTEYAMKEGFISWFWIDKDEYDSARLTLSVIIMGNPTRAYEMSFFGIQFGGAVSRIMSICGVTRLDDIVRTHIGVLYSIWDDDYYAQLPIEERVHKPRGIVGPLEPNDPILMGHYSAITQTCGPVLTVAEVDPIRRRHLLT